MSNLYEQIQEEEAALKVEEKKEESKLEQDAKPDEQPLSKDGDVQEKKNPDDDNEPEINNKGGEENNADSKDNKKADEEKPDASAYARLRREKRELQERLKAYEEQKQTKKEDVDNDPEPNKQENYEQWLEWKDRKLEEKIARIEGKVTQSEQESEQNKLYQGAIKEFQDIEKKFKATAPDYDQAAEHLKKELTRSISLLNSELSPSQIQGVVTNHILKMAAQAAAGGLNPAEELYRMSKTTFGFVEKKEETTKPNLKKIDANKRKSSSPLQSGGKPGSIPITLEAVNDMSLAEFAKLTPSQLRELENQ